jgi:chemotaxis protein methyltransferase CheR
MMAEMAEVAMVMSRNPTLSDAEFQLFQQYFAKHIGIYLAPAKKPLLLGRFAKRLAALKLSSYAEYYRLLQSPAGAAERETAIDLITTHETYFFREPKHFDFLQNHILPTFAAGTELRVWSAASSTGEEAYTLAMLLDAFRSPKPWSVVGTDISQAVLENARKALFPMARGEGIPSHYLKRYCLKGTGKYHGAFLVESSLRERVQFRLGNLTQAQPELGQFELILLRNVLIYFDVPTKLKILTHVVDRLALGGWLMLGHSETLQGANLPLEALEPSIYRKVGR